MSYNNRSLCHTGKIKCYLRNMFNLLYFIYFLLNIFIVVHYSCPSFSLLAPLHPSHCLAPQAILTQSSMSMGQSQIFLVQSLPILSMLIPLLPTLWSLSVLVFMPLVLFCSFVCFVDQVPLISENIGYQSYTACLISLSIILSSSIHSVASFFLLCSIPL